MWRSRVRGAGDQLSAHMEIPLAVDTVRKIVGDLPGGLTVLDVPCGIGRWWPELSKVAQKIVAVDISEGMLGYARECAKAFAGSVEVLQGDSEKLPFGDAEFDMIFSFALFKHLPRPVQYRVMAEFGRVTKRYVVVALGVMNHATYEFWRRRRIAESFPMMPEELTWMAQAAGLTVRRSLSCTTPIGVERLVLLERKL